MDILDVMDLIDVRPHFSSGSDSSLLDDSFTMEPDNLSQSVAREDEPIDVAANETTPATQNFTEGNVELKLFARSTSGSDSEPEDPTNATAGTSAGVEGERANSPPPNCAICLGRCKNKCFTDSCMHQFCFKCLCEWSKVKPECPLCKQTFKSIIHNVKSIHQFEEYHVQPPTVQIAHPDSQAIFDVFYPGHNRIQAWNGSTIRPYYLGAAPFSTASNGGVLPTASGSSSNRSTAASANNGGLRNLLDLYRQEYPGAIANSGTLSQLWRRYVYDRKLYALPVADITGRFRESSARFYRDNPSQIHRLMPWINRDVVCLLRQSQYDVTTVLESINSALTLVNILSPAFRRRLQPFLGNKTAHFIHELNNFARSPYDMIGYDRAVQYSPQTNNEEIVIEFSSSDESNENDQIDVAGENGSNSNAVFTSRSRSTNSSSTNAINLTIHNRLTSASANAGDNRGTGISGSGLGDIQDDVSLVIDLRGESDNNETTSTAQATNNSSNYPNGQNAGTSESDIINSGAQPAVAENIELTSGSSDECEFVLERKPPHLRTPEMVSLDSATDSDVVFVDESKPLNKTSFSSSEEERNDDRSDHKYPNRHNKIAALVQAKKRNQSANLVKSELQDTLYNLGASTSAALRLSLQKRAAGKSSRSEAASSNKRVKRDLYYFRRSDNRLRNERQVPKRRGKRLDSESSHSDSSWSSLNLSCKSDKTSATSKSSSSSSDEDYVMGFHQKKMGLPVSGALKRGSRIKKAKNDKTSATSKSSSGSSDEDYVLAFHKKKMGMPVSGALKRGSRIKKAKNLKASKSSDRRQTKPDLRRRKTKSHSSEDDDEEDDDNGGLRGKNFALVMAINERRKKQDQKNSRHNDDEGEEGQEDEQQSEGEESWRLKAIDRYLRKRQKENAARNSRNRSSKTSTQQPQQGESRQNRKRQSIENLHHKGSETQKSMKIYNFVDTSSDESDNINLIQLKTKLIGQDKNSNGEKINKNEDAAEKEPTKSKGNRSENENNSKVTSSSTIRDYESNPSGSATQLDEACCSGNNKKVSKQASVAKDIAEPKATKEHGLINFSDYSSYNNQNAAQHQPVQNTIDDENVGQSHDLPSSSSQLQNDSAGHNDDVNVDTATAAASNDFCEDDEAMSNVPTTMHLNESNVFADGGSMSTTTTDTILHDTAEQISSAAVNFYNPQQTFNTADFADENSTNSSSSETSVSSSTTSVTSSSNSSSSDA